MTGPWLTEADVARLFKVGKSTVRRWRAAGLRHFRNGDVIRYTQDDVETFQANYMHGAEVVELPRVVTRRAR